MSLPLTPRPYIKLSIEQLNQIKDDDKHSFQQQLALDEIARRKMESHIAAMGDDIKSLKKPHWTIKWTFFIVVATFIISIAAFVLQWRADIRDLRSSVPILSAPSLLKTKSISSSPTLTGPKQKIKTVPSQ